ncbi:Acyl- N-acyltransferase protein [Rutstroemia sp. NJR-2017a BVV2]|nr:Acyl- N-acyltransferase protein [Rutstroemia sp. NJR-2017a BVV2]
MIASITNTQTPAISYHRYSNAFKMPSPELKLSPASESDIPRLATISTSAFSTHDAAFRIVWGNTPPGAHDSAITHLLIPTHSSTRCTMKVEIDGQIAGFALWYLPASAADESGNKNLDLRSDPKDVETSGWNPPEGMNMEFFMQKITCFGEAKKRDYVKGRDMMLDLCFVDPVYQNRGVGKRLLEWGMQKADEMGVDIWLVSTPDAKGFYERAGWETKEEAAMDLGKFGESGEYVRRWMVRKPVR